MTELEFSELVYYICKRPRMYTPTGTFYECVCFIEGLASGYLNPGRYGFAGHSRMRPFIDWICEKRNKDNRRFWWPDFRELFDSDEEAFQELPILYKEYVNDIDFPRRETLPSSG